MGAYIMGAWGNSFGVCGTGSGPGEPVLVEAIRTADVVTTLSASVTEQTATADIIETASASVIMPELTAELIETTEANYDCNS